MTQTTTRKERDARAAGYGRSIPPHGVTVSPCSWGFLVECQVCGASDGFESRTTGTGAERKAKAWRCPRGSCKEIVRLREALRPFANHYPGHESWPVDRGCGRFFSVAEVKAAHDALYPERATLRVGV